METNKQSIKKPISFNPPEKQKGIAIYLAAVILSIVMTVALGGSLITFNQLKNINEASKSVIAFAAAESGIEWALTYVDSGNYDTKCPRSVNLDNGASYALTCELCGTGSEYLCIRSEGNYKGTQE